MMRICLLISFLCCFGTWAQDDFLAKQYYNDGAFEKAKVLYEKLVKRNPSRTDYAEYYVGCLQQLEAYEEAEAFLLKKLEQPRVFPTFYIELGYTYALQEKTAQADMFYDRAIATLAQNPNFAYPLGHRFQKYALLNRAIETYTTAMELKPDLNYDIHLARIYGEQGAIGKMYESYLKLIYEGHTSRSNVLRYLEDFISDDPEDPNNILLRKTLLKNAQRNPDVLWNELLSWLFIQQNQFNSAFAQEKAIYKRTDELSLDRLENLGKIALDNLADETAAAVFEYISQNANQPLQKLNAQLELIQLQLKQDGAKSYSSVDKKFQALIETYGLDSKSLQLQIAYANFLTFNLNTPEPAINLLRKSMEIPMGRYGEAYLKMALGDILVFDQKFNEALIYFTQTQKNLKNDVMGQNARFKVAQTSFYKGDFDWALTQLKVLRSSTSQLIANDAMQLSLLISDNTYEDSTQVALKKYARADLLAYQQKTDDAILLLGTILEEHKGQQIEDEALLKQAELLEAKKKFDDARFNYIKIIEFFNDGILADDAHFKLAQLYEQHLNEPDKAMPLYEKIIYNYQDSYYFPQARKHFRRLRGDAVN
ncbi:tetratricopeptide repeat protein [Croceivirga sp. JEA036]|uniref:tetratricopeptide repeat protein n=1 Tax=Croceivirga sp. JEA036 TaxID=2721162 RepID=UPI00293BA31D|nr:tetratricopeptide repeat protein [Croceivirga sp. JEA036]